MQKMQQFPPNACRRETAFRSCDTDHGIRRQPTTLVKMQRAICKKCKLLARIATGKTRHEEPRTSLAAVHVFRTRDTAFGPNRLTICASFSLGTIPPQSRLMWISAASAARSPQIFRTCSTPPA